MQKPRQPARSQASCLTPAGSVHGGLHVRSAEDLGSGAGALPARRRPDCLQDVQHAWVKVLSRNRRDVIVQAAIPRLQVSPPVVRDPRSGILSGDRTSFVGGWGQSDI